MNDFDFSPSFFFSRAVDYDEEEDEAIKDIHCTSVQSVPAIPTCQQSDDRINCSLLLLAVGPVASGFVKTHVLDEHETQVVGEITACSSAEADSKSSLDTACKLCQLKKLPTVIVLTCDVDVKPEDTFLWTQQLFSHVAVDSTSSAQVVVLTSVSVGSYIGPVPPGDLPPCFLRSLATSSFTNVPVASLLAQPNLVSGLPAQVLTYCEVHSVPAVLYMCYTRSQTVDTSTLTAFRPLRQTKPLADIIVASEKSKQHAMDLSSKLSSANYDLLYL